MRILLLLLVSFVTGALSQVTAETEAVEEVQPAAQAGAPAPVVKSEWKTYEVGIIESAPYAMKIMNGTEEIDKNGYIVDLLKAMEETIGNTTFDLKWDTSGFGHQDEAGNWDGMIQKMILQKYKIGAGPITITEKRKSAVDFSEPFAKDIGITLTVKEKHLKLESAVDMIFFVVRPFSFPVWILFGISFIVFGIAIFALNKFHPFEHKGKCQEGKSSAQEAKALDLGGSFWMAMTLCLLQGFDRKPRSKAGRTLFAIWCAFILLTIILYITSMIEMYRNYGRMTRGDLATVEDIITSQKYELGYISGGTTEKWFTENEQYSELEPVTVTSVMEGLDRVREGNYAMFIESDMLYHAGSLKPCEFSKVGHNLNQVQYGFVLHKGQTEIKTMVDDVLSELKHDGILQKLHNKYFKNTAECPELPESGNFPRAALEDPKIPAKPLSPYEYSGAIVLLIVGLILVTIIAIIENLYIKFKNRPKPSTRPTQEKLIEAEEGQALNQTALTEIGDKKADEEGEPKEDVGKELEPEDKVEIQPGASKEELEGIEARATPAPVEVKS